MQRKNTIKWRDADLEKLESERLSFNRKIYYERRKNPEIRHILPDTIKKKDLKERINTRWDFNREIKSMQAIKEKGALSPVSNKKGVEITKWEYKDTKKRLSVLNKRREAKLQKYDKSRGEQSRIAKMSDLRRNRLTPKKFDFDKKSSKEEWDLFVKSIEKEMLGGDGGARYKANYLTAIDNYLGESGKELKEFLKDVDPQTMLDAYWEEDELLRIQFISDPIEAELISRSALEKWKLRVGQQ